MKHEKIGREDFDYRINGLFVEFTRVVEDESVPMVCADDVLFDALAAHPCVRQLINETRTKVLSNYMRDDLMVQLNGR